MVGNDFLFCKESKLTTYGYFCGFCFNACMKNRIKRVRYRKVKKVTPKEVQERIDKAFDILFNEVVKK